MVLTLGLAGVTTSHAEGRVAEEGGESTKTVLPSNDALKVMSGMSGYYRKAPTGEVFLYPVMKLEEGMYGMYGTYSVTKEGILLRPGGEAGVTMAVSAMGDASGTFRITPRGQAVFYSYQ